MVTPTWCHRAKWGNPVWGECRLTWIPNSHILISIIRLSEVQQLALRFSSRFEISCSSGCPRDPSDLHSFKWSRSEQSETFFCHCSLSFRSSTWHERLQATGMSFSCRCGLFGIWWGETCCAPNSLELESRLMPIGARTDHGPRQGITHDS